MNLLRLKQGQADIVFLARNELFEPQALFARSGEFRTAAENIYVSRTNHINRNTLHIYTDGWQHSHFQLLAVYSRQYCEIPTNSGSISYYKI
jgi:hypothetical protein